MPHLRSNVVAARKRLAMGLQALRDRHRAGGSGTEVCTALTELRDAALRELFDAAVADLGETHPQDLSSQVALVAHGGYGRCDVAPYSDVDLMVLHAPQAADRAAPLSERMLRDVFDAGLVLGHSMRTAGQACRLAAADPAVCTSLMESRLLAGSERLFEHFFRRFQRQLRQRGRTLIPAIERERLQERIRYGETVYLLEPNVKRSSGGLRDLQLLRWVGMARYGANRPEPLRAQGVLSAEDIEALEQAGEFLLRLRNELHFHAGRVADVLSRGEQLRIAELFGYQPATGMLLVEQFMRDYFRHTSQVSHVVARFVARARSWQRVNRLITATFGHRVEGGVRVGPAGLAASRKGLEPLRGNLTEIMRLIGLSNLYDKPIEPSTWEIVRREAGRLPDDLPPEACRRFLSLLDHPARLGPLLRDLHEIRVLQRFIPEYAHARGLLQFNQYHKYTVDEHCFRAVEFATELASDPGVLGRVYRQIGRKHVLHLALLIHDLGKGRLEDHCELARQIAQGTAQRLSLPARDAEALQFLAGRHLLMNHLAFRRDTGDQQLVVRFAVQVGSPEMLRMLLVLTAADLGAVGPDVWDGWKSEILIDLFHHTMQHLAGDSPATILEQRVRRRREATAAQLGLLRFDPWFARRLDALPTSYLGTTEPEQVAADLRLLYQIPPGKTGAKALYMPETEMLQVTVATSEGVAPGIFYKLTGALTSHGLQIRSAVINTLADGLVLDRFWVYDPDFAGESPPERTEEIAASLVGALHAEDGGRPSFRRTWRPGGHKTARAPRRPSRVNADNSTSDRYTVLDIFAHDRAGLLYTIARALFELGLSVWRAKIGTYLDQVVDVFYVTDARGQKIEDEPRVEQIRHRLLEVIDSFEDQTGS
ncbi:MAG: [protein-PII] uridylyltransferase [Pirellulales bacterium]|nr:[protein-PII] uridylyltransferase [Pirellulales bacterium]